MSCALRRSFRRGRWQSSPRSRASWTDPFAIRISTAFDWCTASGIWTGWGVDVTFLSGRPEPGTYVLGQDSEVTAQGNYAESEVEALPSNLDGATLQILEVEVDGTVRGALCDVELRTYDKPLQLSGQFLAAP